MSLMTRQELYSMYSSLQAAKYAIEEAEEFIERSLSNPKQQQELVNTLAPIKARVALEEATERLKGIFG